eukprot:COSAG01_NODE_5765_length_4043_cov_3.138804_6_plen_93_part_01
MRPAEADLDEEIRGFLSTVPIETAEAALDEWSEAMETRCVFQHQLPAVPGCAADIAHTVGLRSMELVAKGKEGISNRRGYLMGVIKRGASAHP